jgi:large subunit ribosomal protein L6e
LKTLASGNLLVSGPYAINGVPLRRVNPAYVIATSTKVSLEGVNVNVDDTFFKKARRYTKNELKNASEHRLKKVEAGNQQNSQWRSELKNVQKTVDSKLLENIKKVEHLRGYLGTRFTLTNSSRPHDLKF